jgi:hypothetical protein
MRGISMETIRSSMATVLTAIASWSKGSIGVVPVFATGHGNGHGHGHGNGHGHGHGHGNGHGHGHGHGHGNGNGNGNGHGHGNDRALAWRLARGAFLKVAAANGRTVHEASPQSVHHPSGRPRTSGPDSEGRGAPGAHASASRRPAVAGRTYRSENHGSHTSRSAT